MGRLGFNDIDNAGFDWNRTFYEVIGTESSDKHLVLKYNYFYETSADSGTERPIRRTKCTGRPLMFRRMFSDGRMPKVRMFVRDHAVDETRSYANLSREEFADEFSELIGSCSFLPFEDLKYDTPAGTYYDYRYVAPESDISALKMFRNGLFVDSEHIRIRICSMLSEIGGFADFRKFGLFPKISFGDGTECEAMLCGVKCEGDTLYADTNPRWIAERTGSGDYFAKRAKWAVVDETSPVDLVRAICAGMYSRSCEQRVSFETKKPYLCSVNE